MNLFSTRSEVEDFLTPELLERVYGCAINAAQRRDLRLGYAGLRAAQARDPKLMRVAEALAEYTDKRDDEIRGRTKREVGARFVDTFSAQETALCREAFNAAEEGRPDLDRMMFVYGACAAGAGLVTKPSYWGAAPRQI